MLTRRQQRIALKDSGYTARAGETIRGRLGRGGDGKFTAVGNAQASAPRLANRYSAAPKRTAPPTPKAPKGGGKGGGKGGKGAAAAKPKLTPEQRKQQHDAQARATRHANEAKVGSGAGLGQNLSDALLEFASPDEVIALAPQNQQALLEKGLIELGPDGQARISAAGRSYVTAARGGDVSRARDALGRGDARQATQRTQAAAAQARTDARAKRLAERAAKQKKGSASGGAGKKPAAKPTAAKPTAAEQATASAQKKAETAATTGKAVGLPAADVDFLRGAANGTLPDGSYDAKRLMDLGLVEDTGDTTEATDAGRRALTALERGDVRGYQAALQDARQKRERTQTAAGKRTDAAAKRDSTAQQRKADQAKRDAERQQARDARASSTTARNQRRVDALTSRAKRGEKLTATQRDQLVEAGVAQYDGPMWRLKAQAGLTVFKDASGRERWIARSTTAYRDRDREILSTKALEDDAARMQQTGQYGPLRWWHVGTPDPLNSNAPWGPGVDLGWCDFSTVIGRTAVESGTFKSAAIAQWVATHADQFELSPGFFHTAGEPDAAGVFHTLKRFERSLVPVKYGRASNLYTGLTVQEKSMPVPQQIRYKALGQQQVDQRLAALKAMGVSDATLAQITADVATTEKAAAADGVAFKSAQVFTAPDGTPGIIAGGQWVALKAAPLEEDKAAPAAMVDDSAVDGMPEPDADDSDNMLTPAEIQSIVDGVVSGLSTRMDELSSKMATVDEELKGRGYQRMKEAQDTNAAEITALKTRLAELEGDQPAVTAPATADLEAALKGGPAGEQSAQVGGWETIFEKVASGTGSNAEFAARLGQPRS